MIFEDGEMEMSQDGTEMASNKEEINAESADEGEFQSLYQILIISRQVELLYFAHKLPKSKIINCLNSVKTLNENINSTFS